MNTPNPELMHLYGTDAYYLEKTGQFPLLAKLLGAAGSVGLYLHDKKHQEQLLAEAAQVNQQLRAEEARRMRNVERAISGTGGIPFRSRPLPPPAADDLHIPAPTGDPVMLRFERDLDDEMAKGSSADMRAMAEHIGRCMARQHIEDLYKTAAWQGDDTAVVLLEKLASGVPLTEFEKEALSLSSIGSGIGGFVKKIMPRSGTAKFTAAAKAEGVAPAAGPGLMSRLKAKVSPNARLNQTLEREGLGDVAQGMKAKVPKGAPAGPTNIEAGPYRMKAQQSAPSMPAPAAGAAPGAAAAAAPAAAGAPAAADAAKSKPWLSGWTKAKIGLGAAGLGAGYLGYKALQTGRDYMLQPGHTGGAYGHYGPQVTHDVNPQGYVNPY